MSGLKKEEGGVARGGFGSRLGVPAWIVQILLLVSPTAAKTYLAAVFLGTASSLRELSDAARLSQPTVINARRELVDRGLLHCLGDAYILPPRPAKTPKGRSVPSLEDRRMVVKSACHVLGVAETSDYVRLAMEKLTRLLQAGSTIDEALEVARYARAAYDAGDRFKPYLNLLHVWSAGKFPPLLAAARLPASGKEYRVGAPGPARDQWDATYLEKLKSRGLA